MSADTAEGREADKKETLDAIAGVIMRRAGWAEAPALALAEDIYNAEPLRCDFDCDHCRE